MSGAEVAYRVSQTTHAHAQRLGMGRARWVEPRGSAGRPWVDPIPREFDVQRYEAAADRVLAGTYRVFAMRDVPLGFPPRWNRDPKTGRTAPMVFGKTLDYRDESLVGDIKYLWEPNRHLELVTLAQAWHLTRAERYAAGCRQLLESWLEQCPYLVGPNWTSSLELGIRLVNWSFAWHLLGGEAGPLFEGGQGAEFRHRWLASIRQHCHFVAGHLSRHSSANNHLLGERFGLLVAAVTWPLWPESASWAEASRREFEAQALEQNAPDGVNREQATWYHHEVADMMLIAGCVARAGGMEFSDAYWRRWESMMEFLASIMDVSGHVPAFGDSDDACMVRFDPAADFCAYRSLLASAALLRGRDDFARKAGGFDDKTRWLLGDRAVDAAVGRSAGAAAPPVTRAFAHGGYYVLGSDFDTSREVRIVADAGPLGYLSIAAHGHADALSFTASAGGRELLIDPGTFAYHTDKAWRDYFRGTSAHNTLRVDGLDQSVAGGNFLWLRHADGHCLEFESSAHRDRLLARQAGYRRLADPVIHQRELVYEGGARLLRVTDGLSCRGAHEVEMFWHFSELCEVTLSEHAIVASSGDVLMHLSWPDGFQATLVRAQQHPPLGWVSRSFDEKSPTVTAVVRGAVRGEWRGVSTIRFGFPGCEAGLASAPGSS